MGSTTGGPRPPALARAVLRWRLPAALHDSFAGDLEERFARLVGVDPRAARRAYWKDVLSPTVLRFRREARGMALPPGSSPGSTGGDGTVSTLLADLKFAARMLTRSPGFTAIAVLSLALGIGPNAAVFTLVDAIMLRDWGVGQPERIVDVYNRCSDGYCFSGYGTYELVRDGTSDVFEGVTQHSIFDGRIEGPDGVVEHVLGEMVEGNYFDVMGVQAQLGRTFVPEEYETLGTHPVVVLSDDQWRARFGGDPALVGGEIRLNGRPYTVVGIAPPEFRGRIAPGAGTDFWVPYSMYPHLNPSKPGAGDLTITGRIREGVEPGVAMAAVRTVAARRDQELNEANPDRRGRFELTPVWLPDVRIHPAFDDVVGAMAALLLVAVGLVLLVACVNLAGFLLSRAVDRRKEMAIRVAMGAGRGAVIRQLVVESLVLAALGGALGLVLGQVAAGALAGIEAPLPLPLDLEVGLSPAVLLFTAGTALVAAVLFGLTPALEALRAPVAATLRDEAGSSGGRRKVGVRGFLVGAQMALSTVLLFGAALFVRSLQAATTVEVGFSTDPAAVVTVQASEADYTAEERIAFAEELVRRLEARPAVTEVGITTRMPLALGMMNFAFDIPGVDPPPDQNRHVLELARVTPGYFSAMEIPILEGRAFETGDRQGSPPVAILSRAAADRYWPGESAVGRLLYPGGDAPPVTVVGVAGDVKIWSLTEPPRPYVYMPYLQGGGGSWLGGFYLVARGNQPAGELAASVRSEASSIDPGVLLTEVGTMSDHLRYIYFLPRMAARLLSLVGGLALVLACIGLYGMVSYGVSRRTREMGIRLALGSDRAGVVGLVLKGGLGLVAVGGAAGVLASLAMGRLAERFLLGVAGLDPLALLAAPVVLSTVAVLAAYFPARRASRVDPTEALRAE